MTFPPKIDKLASNRIHGEVSPTVRNDMALMLAPETYRRLEKRLGEEEAKDIVGALNEAVEATNKKTEEIIARLENKADSLITQKKFELKDELTEELATKTDIAVLKIDIERLEGMIKTNVERLEGMIKTMKAELDRKFTIMFVILLFAIIFVNQNALEYIAKLTGLVKP